MAKLLIAFGLVMIFLGGWFVWTGLQPQVHPESESFVTTPLPTAFNPDQTRGIAGEQTKVVKVVDGDTIVVQGEISVRLIGIDTPETVDPKRPVGCFGKEASEQTKQLLSNRLVILQKDTSESDKYGRKLRYVFLPLENNQMLFVDDYLVREGFAKVLTYPPDTKFDSQLREAENEAKAAKKGLWGKCGLI